MSKTLNINKYKGLRQDVDYPELPLQYCHVLQNIDVDDPLGRLTVRGGYADKYDAASHANYPFTDIKSAYEYRFEVSSQTVLIVNDNGTLKTMTNGGNPASLTLPGVAALESGFVNQYMGYKDHVIITAGNGATNYVLWYGYVDRENDDNKGLFGNVKENTGYILTKAQLICPNGMFSNIKDIATLGDYYYISFDNSKYIEKRDSNFHLIERRVANTETAEAAGIIPITNVSVSLATDGTYLYVGYDSSTTQTRVEKVNPSGWTQEDIYTPAAAGTDAHVKGICVDSVHVYVLRTGTDYGMLKAVTSNMAHVDGDNTDMADDGIDICCDDTANTGNFYILRDNSGAGGNDEIVKRKKSDLTEDSVEASYQDFQHCDYNITTNTISVSSLTGDGHVYSYTEALVATDLQNIDEPKAFVLIGTATLGISSKYGTVEVLTSGVTSYPGLIGINHVSSAGSGNIDAGTYFYKISVVDQDGQEYTLSDFIVVNHTSGSQKVTLRIIAHTDYMNDLYRVAYINIYRATNTTSGEEKSPSTDYKFLKQIDINSTEWVDDETDQELFYYDYIDNIDEATISTTTYLENSGIEDTVKPRYVNGKYMVWVNNELHLSNFSHDGDTYRNRTIRSPDDQPDNIAFYNYYDYDVGDGEEIKGITELFGRSIVFKNRKFGVFYNGAWEKGYVPGLSSPEGYYKIGDAIYFVSDVGLHVFDGGRVINLHYPVVTLFNAASSYANAAVFFFDSKDRIIFSLRGDRSLIYNTKYKTWTYYTSNFAFRGYFKNYENEYIGWTQRRFNILLNSTYVDDAEDYGGGGGTGIAIDYESPLLFGGNNGHVAIPITHSHRILKGSDTITFTLYEHRNTADGKYSTYTQAIDATGGSVAANKTYYIDPVLGETFSIRLSGTIAGGDFEYHGLSMKYNEGGAWIGR